MKLRDLVAELENVKTWEKPRVELEQYPTPPEIAAHMLMMADAEGDVEDALVADLGCGGCILGIAAALLGAGHVMGVDIDPAVLSVAAQNADEAEVSVDLVACDVLELATRTACSSSASSCSGVGHSSAANDKLDGMTAGAAAATAAEAFPAFIATAYTTKVEYEKARAAAAEAAVATAMVAAVSPAAAGAASAAGALTLKGGSLEETGHLPPIGHGAFDLVIMNPPFGTQQASNGMDMRFLRAGLTLCAPDGAVYSLNKTSTRRFIAKTAASWGASARVLAELQFEIPRMYKHHKHASLDVEVDFWRFTPQMDTEGAEGAVATQAPFSALQGGGGKGGGRGAGGRGRGEERTGKGGRAGKGAKDDGRDCRRAESQQAVAGSRQTARANAKARVDFYGGGGSGKSKKTESTKRGDGVRVTKLDR